METKKIEHVTYTEVYVAVDGQEFNNADECRKYEDSAVGVLLGRLKKMAIKTGSESDLFAGAGSDENHAFVVIPKNDAEVATIQQIVYLKAYGKDWKEKFAARVAVGKVLIVTMAFDYDGCWVSDLGDIVSGATGGAYKIAENK